MKKLKKLLIRLDVVSAIIKPEMSNQVYENLKFRIYCLNDENDSLRGENIRLNHVNFNLEKEIKELKQPSGLPTL